MPLIFDENKRFKKKKLVAADYPAVEEKQAISPLETQGLISSPTYEQQRREAQAAQEARWRAVAATAQPASALGRAQTREELIAEAQARPAPAPVAEQTPRQRWTPEQRQAYLAGAQGPIGEQVEAPGRPGAPEEIRARAIQERDQRRAAAMVSRVRAKTGPLDEGDQGILTASKEADAAWREYDTARMTGDEARAEMLHAEWRRKTDALAGVASTAWEKRRAVAGEERRAAPGMVWDRRKGRFVRGPTVAAAARVPEGVTAEQETFLGNVIGDIEPGLALEADKYPAIKALQKRADAYSKRIAARGGRVMPAVAQRITALQKQVAGRLKAIEKTYRAAQAKKKVKEAREDKEFARKRTEAAAIKETKAKTAKENQLAASGLNRARAALSKKDYDRAEAVAQATLEYWANTKSTTALQGVLDDVRIAKVKQKAEVTAKEKERKEAEAKRVKVRSEVREARLARKADVAEKRWDRADAAYRKYEEAMAAHWRLRKAHMEGKTTWGPKGIDYVKEGIETKAGKAETKRLQAAWDAAAEALPKAKQAWDAAEEKVLSEIGTRAAVKPVGPTTKGEQITEEAVRRYLDFYGDRETARRKAEADGWRF